jgi:hypothetical protein
MPLRCAKLLKVLRAELEDLLDDIDLVERRIAQRFAKDEIMDYVYWENTGLVKMESESIKRLLFFIDKIDLSSYKDCNGLTIDLEKQVREIVREHEDPEAVLRFFLRKLKKVHAYIDSDE